MRRLSIFFFVLITRLTYSQNITQQVFVVGNTMEITPDELQKLSAVIEKQTTPVTLVYCGDIIHIDELKDKPGPKDSAFIRSLLQVGKSNESISVYFIAGDRDWDESGKKGLKAVKNLELFINGIAQKEVFLPASGCPGPEILNINDDLEIILINSQWLIHPYERPYEPDDDCKALTEPQFKELLEEAIEEATDKNLLIVGHHPVLSNGEYGGRINFVDHFTPPVIGTFKAAYRQNIGTPKYMAYPAYHEYSQDMRQLMINDKPFIYASSHEYNMQVLNFEQSYQVISGSIGKVVSTGKSKNTAFKSRMEGFIGISYYDNGKVTMNAYEFKDDSTINIITNILYKSACEIDSSDVPVNTRFVPCKEETKPLPTINSDFRDSTGTAIAGQQYKAGLIKKIFLGNLYRSSWTAEVRVPYLNLDTAKSGLEVTGVGGGRQTQSLSFNGADGKSYVFRSVDKDPVKAFNPVLRNTFVVNLARQFTATQNPYGALVVNYLLDRTSILHAKPELYLLPDDAKLGMFQQEFKGMMGMLEEKPRKDKDNLKGSFNADDITRSYGLFKKLYKNHDHRVDEKAFLKARIFDIWIGDWGRHEDNWKWAEFKQGDKTTYFPIPRDRDHAFSLWNGILPYLVSRKWALPNAENFGYHFKDIRSLTYPARYLDRFLITSLSKDEWLALSSEIRHTMTDEVIDSAIQQLPQEIIPIAGNTIAQKLKTRREELDAAVMKYYSLLSTNVSVTGSNKKEKFHIKRLPDNSVEVTMSAREKPEENLYHRKFFPTETEYINVYGLDGDDEFILEGNSKKSILIRIFGGKGDDLISNTSTIHRNKKSTYIYEYSNADKNHIIPGKNSKVVFSDDRSLVEYNRRPVHHNSYLPLPMISYTKEDGVEFGLGVSYVFHKFGEDGYANKLKISDRFSSKGAIQVKITDEFHHLFGKWDLLLGGEIAQPYPSKYFYGKGNETVKDGSLPVNYYQSTIYGYNVFTGLQKVFWKKSSFILDFSYEENNAILYEDHFLSANDSIFGINREDFFGSGLTLDIDFRDNAIIPKQGVRFFGKQSVARFYTSKKKEFANSEALIEFYQSSRTLIPVTIGITGGIKHAAGNIPYYKLNTLGRTTGLRGFTRDRFAGYTTAYVNSQLNLEFGILNTSVVPLTYGIFGFYEVGRVWIPDESSDKLHAGYGAGIYFTPLLDVFTTRISIAFSEEEKKGILEAGFGVRF